MKDRLFALGVVTGSGNLVTHEEPITGFDKVDVSNAFTVEIAQGDTFSVVIRIDDNLVQYLEVIKRANTLKIGLKPGRITRNATLEAEVTMPELAGLDLSGASHGSICGLKSTRALDVDLSGASHLQGDIEAGDTRFDISGASHMTLGCTAQDVTIDASGASHVTLTGSAENVTIDASGASHVNLTDLRVADADIEVSGASTVTVNPSDRLDVEASGASHVYYVGSPTLGKIDTSGGSSVDRE